MTVYKGQAGAQATWTVDTDTGVLTISGTGSMYDKTAVSQWGWYEYASSIKQVVIESGITSVGAYAFGTITYSSLASVTIADTVTSINKNAFANCGTLTSIVIPDSVRTIADWAFSGAGLTSVIIPAGVKTIGVSAFDCKSLTSVTFLGQPTSIDASAFSPGTYSDPCTITIHSDGWASADTLTPRDSSTTFIYKGLNPTVHVNVGGTWKEAVPYVNVGGTWKEVTEVHVNVNGTWKEVG